MGRDFGKPIENTKNHNLNFFGQYMLGYKNFIDVGYLIFGD